MSSRQAYDTPGVHDKIVAAPAHLAATATEIVPVFEAPVNCRITKVTFRPGAAVTGANTNTTHLNVIDMGVAGTGTSEKGNYDLISGNDLAAGEAKALYAPAGGLAVSQGNLIGLQFEKVGTGLTVPAGAVIVEFEPE